VKKTIAVVCLLLATSCTITHAQQLEWLRQGVAGNVDYSRGVSADGLGNVYISGVIFDDLVKSFVRKYDAAGNLLWDREILDDAEWSLGLSEWTEGYDVSADGQGSVYSVGFTEGELAGTYGGGQDAFIAKYNEDGTRQWIRQFGSSADDIGYSVSTDQLGSVFMSGSLNGDSSNPSAALENAFINKYDAAGNLQWTSQFGVANMSEVATGVSADGLGGAYVVGSKFSDGFFNPSPVPSDVFLNKYGTAGNLLWTTQFGTMDEDERATGVSADGLGNVYVSLNTMGDNIPMQLGSLRKYNELGSLLWTYQPEQGSIAGVSTDGLGNVYISGSGEQLSPDTYVSKLNASGALLWTVRFAESGNDDYLMHVSYGVSADGLGNVFSAGQVDDFSASINFDSFVAKISVPEPTSLTLIAFCIAPAAGVRKNRSR
jgi:hypothetical protein